MGWGKLRPLSQAFCFRAGWSNRLLLLASSRRQGPTGLCKSKVALSGQDCHFVIRYSRRSSWLCTSKETLWDSRAGAQDTSGVSSLLPPGQGSAPLCSVIWASPSLPSIQGSGSALLRAGIRVNHSPSSHGGVRVSLLLSCAGVSVSFPPIRRSGSASLLPSM